MRKNVITSAIVAIVLALGVPAGVASAQPALLGGHVVDRNDPVKSQLHQTYSQFDMFKCAGAVQQAEQIIHGKDHSKYALKQYDKAVRACEKAVDGF